MPPPTAVPDVTVSDRKTVVLLDAEVAAYSREYECNRFESLIDRVRDVAIQANRFT